MLAGKEGADLEGIRKAGARHRQRRPIAELTVDMDAKVNGQLRDLGEPKMIVEEAMGLRLYTGPLFVKYNAVLRGLNSKVAFLQKALVGYCCDAATAEQFANGTITYADAKIKLNRFTTTLHVINSGIVKTSKLTYAGKVYRGVSGLEMPPEFWRCRPTRTACAAASRAPSCQPRPTKRWQCSTRRAVAAASSSRSSRA